MTWPRTSRQDRFVEFANQLAEPIRARAGQVDRENRFPFENFELLRESGYLTLTLPREYGGQGADPIEFALATERIAHACGSTGLTSHMHLALIGRFAHTKLWPDEIFARVARDVVENGALINAINSELDLGSPSRGGLPSTTAVRTPFGWRVNGRKRWASLSTALTYAYSLVAVIDGNDPPKRGNLLIRMDSPGVQIEETWHNLGMRGTASNDVVYEDVEVPNEHLLPAESAVIGGEGSEWYSFPGAAMYLGIALAARDEAIEFARTRVPNGMPGPIAELQTIQHKVAEMELLILQARTLLYATAEEWLARPERRSGMEWQIAAVKSTVTNAVLRVTEIAQRIVGSVALTDESPLQRFFRDARTSIGHPPMEDAVLTLVGKTALGLIRPKASEPEFEPAIELAAHR